MLAYDENPKSFYRYVNSKRKVKTGLSEIKRQDGTFATTDAEKAKELNDYFKRVFVVEDATNIPDIDNRSNGETISDIEINE